LLLHGRWLIRIWVGENYLSAFWPLLVLNLGQTISFAQSPSITLLVARGRNKALGWWQIGEALANFGLSVYWAHTYGILGVALGTAVPQIFVKLTLQPWVTLRVAGISWADYFLKALARPLSVWGVFLTVSWLGRALVASNGFVPTLCLILSEVFIYCALAYAVGLTAPDRELILERGRRLVGVLGTLKAA
jgi:O-antigen/teichoic acid export membrane protein